MTMPRTSAAPRRHNRAVACTSILTAGVIALAGCSAVSGKKTTTSEGAGASTSSAAPRTGAATAPPNPLPSVVGKQPIGDATLATNTRGDLGEILVDGTKRTLYAFSKDTPKNPTCYGACAETWLPLLSKSDHPAGGIGIDDASTGTVMRSDGGKQATYKGIPLYQYAGDEIDSDAKGQGFDLFGGQWYVLTKDGVPLK